MLHNGCWSLYLLALFPLSPAVLSYWTVCPHSCLSLVGSVNRLSFMAAGYGSLSLYACVFVFIAVGCHLKSGGASQSALNPAGWREGGLESGEGRNKSTPKSDSNLGRGRAEVGCCAFVCLISKPKKKTWPLVFLLSLSHCLVSSKCSSSYSLLLFPPLPLSVGIVMALEGTVMTNWL